MVYKMEEKEHIILPLVHFIVELFILALYKKDRLRTLRV